MQCLKRYWSILPTKVSAFYIFALVASSCYSLLQRPCTRCNHCVTASQNNTLRQHVTTCKKTFGEQKVGGSNPSGRTTKALKSLGFKAFLFPFFRPKTDIYHFFITIDLDSMVRSDVVFSAQHLSFSPYYLFDCI